ncbi:PAS domain-containing protein [Falsihalocynthiibacter sp. SS001]|uniref:PAS domain-containing protein n=1 Tax=Falsihalocynthiibacter sp. SS001 TaxID=3349698 RepID=UPI0036D3A2A5
MSYPAINAVIAYWDGLRAGRAVPMRSEVDPRGIEPALENAFILERIAPGMARIRLAGAHMSDLMGMEVRGMPFTAFFCPTARKDMSDILEAVFNGPEIADITLESDKGIGKPPLSGKIVLLPLKSDLGDVTRILGCFVTTGEIGRGPRRFEVTERRLTQVSGGPAIPRAVEEITEDQAPVASGFQEPATEFRHKGRPKLRLLTFDN